MTSRRLLAPFAIFATLTLWAGPDAHAAQEPGAPAGAAATEVREQTDPLREHGKATIKALLEKLKTARDPARAKALRERLMRAWTASGPASAQALLKEAARAQADGLIGTARQLYDMVAKRWPEYEDAHFRRAYFLWQLGRHEAALAVLDGLLKRSPGYFPALVLRIHILRAEKRWREALKACRRLKTIAPLWEEWEKRCRRMELRVQRDI